MFHHDLLSVLSAARICFNRHRISVEIEDTRKKHKTYWKRDIAGTSKVLDSFSLKIKCQFYQHFTNPFYMHCTDPKSRKQTNGLIVFYALSGSASVKAVHKILTQLTPGLNFTNQLGNTQMYQKMYFDETSFITKTPLKFTSMCTGKLDVEPNLNNLFSLMCM